MSVVKHTPGKWLAAAKPSSVVGWPVVAAPMGQVICDVAIINKKPDHVNDGEFSAYYAQIEANARLIAAAPDLLEALEWLVETSGDPDSAHLGRARDNAISIFARARGEQSQSDNEVGNG